MDRDKLLQALQNAHNAGDTAAAQRIAGMIKSLPAPSAQPAPAAQDPMLPSPDTDTRSTEEYLRDTGQAEQPLVDVRGYLEAQAQSRTPQSTAGDVGLAIPAGLSQGATELAALPGSVGNLLDMGYEKLGLIPQGSRENIPDIAGGIRNVASALTSGGSDYQAQTTMGQYAQTPAQFVGGGTGVIPGIVGGLLSEAAGQATEGTPYEPYARAVGGIVGTVAGTRNRPLARAGDPNTAQGQRAMMANQLRREGTNVTYGQQTNSPIIRRMEGTVDAPDVQPEQLTSVLMRRIGSNADIATPQSLASVQDDLVKQMDDAVAGVQMAPSAQHAAAADDVVSSYVANVETGAVVPRVREIATDIANRARSGSPISLEDVRTYRQDIGAMTVSSNPATRRAAHALRNLLDDITDTGLRNAGRTDDIARLADARTRYRDFLAMRDASTRAGAEDGVLSMPALNESFKRVMGRENWGVGNTTEAADFARSAAAMTRPAPAVLSGGRRALVDGPSAISGVSAGALGLSQGMSPTAAALLAAGGYIAPTIGQMGMRSPVVQSLLTNPATLIGQAVRGTPGVMAGQQR